MCNGLINKVQYVSDLLTEEDLDILFLQETELKSDVSLSLLQISGYNIEMANTDGVVRTVAYVKTSIIYTRKKEANGTNVILLNLDKKYAVTQLAGIYRPFKMTENQTQLNHFRQQLKEITNWLKDEEMCLLTGDFNLDFNKCNVQIYQQRRIYDELLELSYAFELTQLVKEITWARVYQGVIRSSILDHVYTNNEDNILNIRVEKQPISDHSVVIIKTKGQTKTNEKTEYEYDCWMNYSKTSLLDELLKYDFKTLETLGAQDMADKLDHVLGTIRDKLITKKFASKLQEHASLPEHIIRMKSKLKHTYKRAKKTKNVLMMKKARCIEKEIRSKIVENKTKKIRKEVELGPANLWKAVKIANNTKIAGIPTLSSDGTQWAKSDKEKADLFGEVFERKIETLTAQMRVDLEQEDLLSKINGNYETNWVNETVVKTIMCNLKAKRCQGYDRIPLIFYNDGAEVLTPVVTSLMRKIINECTVPEQWKLAKVIPVFKKGSKTSPNNYRPISNLCSITKIFERLILERIGAIEKLEGVDLTGQSQHGFKKNRSTETAAIEIQTRISGWCDENEYVTVTSLDLTAAFDVVDHGLLMKRLSQVGIPKILTNVIKEWLKDRQFYCEVGAQVSKLINITHGTVQGSILGPILFAIFISPLEKVVKYLVTFADDNFVLNHHKQQPCVLTLTEDSVGRMHEWMIMNGMMVSEEKTEICMFHQRDVEETRINMGNHAITVKKNIKILGIIFDSKLNWQEQARSAMKKANKAKQGLSIIRKYFTQKEMLRLSTAYFYSTLYYGSRVWLISTLHGQIKKQLWQISSRMLRLVEGHYGRMGSFMELHKKYNRASPNMWCNYVTAVAMWDLLNNQAPEATFLSAMMNRLFQGRREGILFTRSNKKKIGFNCLSNRLQSVSQRLKMNWQDMNKMAFKRLCKETFIERELEEFS